MYIVTVNIPIKKIMSKISLSYVNLKLNPKHCLTSVKCVLINANYVTLLVS